MCGIFGQVGPTSEETLSHNAERALAALQSRGPNAKGTQRGKNWILAHRRLAIFDTSETGNQPMQGWGHTIVFNGAIYNFKVLRRELESSGYLFKSGTDTEVILAAYDKWGNDCFQRFNGMWALAILTEKSGKLILSRDRFGIKPLYYSLTEGLIFASEPKLVADTSTLRTEINLRVAAEFIEYGWQDHRQQTLYSNVLQFPPGHYGEVELAAPQLLNFHAYYSLQGAVDSLVVPESERVTIENVHNLIVDSVRLRSQSDVGRCVTLSGGIDSSSIVGILSQHLQGNPQVFSVLYPYIGIDETPYVSAVADRYALDCVAVEPTYSEVMAGFLAAQKAQGQPLASFAVVAHHQLMQRISRCGQRVVLNGQGADEIGAGYDKFYWPLLREQWKKNALSGGYLLSQILLRRKVDYGKALARGRARFNLNRDEKLLGPQFSSIETAAFVRQPDADVAQTSINLMQGVGLPVLLRHEDRNSMAFGLESRAPFLDHRLVEYIIALPSEWKLKNLIRKYIIREACKDVLPHLVYKRQRKLGFATPAVDWIERDRKIFLDAARAGVVQGYFTPTVVERCQSILSKRRREHYGFVFRCFSWIKFVESER